MTNFKYSCKIFALSKSKYWIWKFILIRFRSVLRKAILLNIPQQKSIFEYNVDKNTKNKI